MWTDLAVCLNTGRISCHLPAHKNLLQFIFASRGGPYLSAWHLSHIINRFRHAFFRRTLQRPNYYCSHTHSPPSHKCMWDPRTLLLYLRGSLYFEDSSKASSQTHTHPRGAPQALPAQKPPLTFSHWNSGVVPLFLCLHCCLYKSILYTTLFLQDLKLSEGSWLILAGPIAPSLGPCTQ